MPTPHDNRGARRTLWALTILVALFASAASLQAAAPVAGSSARLVTVIVKLDDDPVATYRGHIQGLAPTSPQVTGAARIDQAHPTVQAYHAYLRGRHAAFEAAAVAAIPGARVLHRYDMVFGGVALHVPESRIASIARLPGVRAVYRDTLQHPDTTKSPTFIGATVLWGKLHGQASAGEDVIVGVIDTGIWPEHPSFSDPDPGGKPYQPLMISLPCNFSTGANPGPSFACNNKLIGAYRFMTSYDAAGGTVLPGDFSSARDSEGHGTHTASTAAGNRRVAAEVFDVRRGTASGIAPRARVIMYKVCGFDGCFGSDSVAAVNRAIADGVDVINFSISGGIDPYNDPVEIAFRDAYAAGVFVAASAGNDGPAANTVNHRGPWVTTVAASTESRQFSSRITLTAPTRQRLIISGASITPGISAATPVTVAASAGDAFCANGTPGTTFAGQIVVCQRGNGIARAAKSFNVKQRGALGMILYNPTPQELATDNHWIPSVHVDSPEGTALLTFLAAHPGTKATFTQGTVAADKGDVMAAFSSRGGTAQGLGVSKPDVTAPGVQILAGNTPDPSDPTAPPGELFQAIEGTSMSSPHVAGAGALLKALHPSWTAGQIKSALMTTAASAKLVKEDGATRFDTFDAGSGRIDLTKAGDPGLTFDVAAADYTAHVNDLWTVNYPSLYLPPGAPGSVTVQRTARSELTTSTVWSLAVTAPVGLTVTVPPSITVPPGGTFTFPITVNKSGLGFGHVGHATLDLKSGVHHLRLPITAAGPITGIDLQIIALAADTSVTRGGSINLSMTPKNAGTVSAGPFRINWFLSTDAFQSSSDVSFAFCPYTGLAAGASLPCFGPVPVPSVSAGQYFVIGVVDTNGQVIEDNENNNRMVFGPITVH